MRTMLIAGLLALAACSGENPPDRKDAEAPAPATSPPATSATTAEIVAAERAFAADAKVMGWVEAFDKWSAEDAIVLQAGPSSAKEFVANINPQVRGDTSLDWGPEFAGVSAAGDFGFTTGPFNGGDTAFGYYFTVWRKQAGGQWRWIYDGGTDTLPPTTVDAAFRVLSVPAPAASAGSADAAKTEIAAIESGMASDVSPDTLAAKFADTSRMHRQKEAPAIGKAAITALLARGPAATSFKQVQAHASATGDMVFTLGEARWKNGAGYYGRIWAREANGWRIVYDQIVLRDLPPL
jgi:hypothetical protein